MKHREDAEFLIEGDNRLFLIHKVQRPDIKSESKVCVGEAIPIKDGYYEIVVAKRSTLFQEDRTLIGVTDSQIKAIELLWEQRQIMNWGYYQ